MMDHEGKDVLMFWVSMLAVLLTAFWFVEVVVKSIVRSVYGCD